MYLDLVLSSFDLVFIASIWRCSQFCIVSARFVLRLWFFGFWQHLSLRYRFFALRLSPDRMPTIFLVFGPACMGERGTLLSVGEPTLDEIGTSLE